jgi:hypothetical protein
MREEKRLLTSIALGSLPALAVIILLIYVFSGQLILIEGLEFWGLCVLAVANFLLLLRQVIRGGVRKRLSVFLLAIAAAAIYMTAAPVDLARTRLVYFIFVCALTALNLTVFCLRRRSPNS